MMRARIVASLEEVGLDERAWNDLLLRSETNTVFQTYQWTRSWWKAFGDQYELFFVTVSDQAGVCGIAPLVIEPGRERTVRFLGDGRADYCDILAARNKAAVVDAMFAAIFASRHRWDVIALNNIPDQSTTGALVREACDRHGYHGLTNEQFVCPTLLLGGHEEAAIRIFNKSALRRRQNYFERNGRLVCRNVTDPAEITPYLERFFNQHALRWNASKSPSLFVDERNRAFYRELTASLGERGWVLFSVVAFNDHPIAFHYGFDYNNGVLWYKPSFDLAYRQHSPGLVLVRHLIGYCIQQKRRELDFTVGDEPFKSRFTNHKRKTMRVRIFRSRVRYLWERSKRGLVDTMKGVRERG